MGSDKTKVDTAKWGRKHQGAKSGRGGPNIALIATVAILAYLVILFAKNGQVVQINFVVYHKTMTLRWLIILCILLGVLASLLFGFWWRRRGNNNGNNNNNNDGNNDGNNDSKDNTATD